MCRQQPVKITLYSPKTADSQLELSKRVAAIHADAVAAQLKSLPCPESQKLALLDAIIATARKNFISEKANPKSIHNSTP